MGRKRKKNLDFKIYTLLLTSIVILTESLKKYTLSVLDYKVTYCVFLLPVSYYVVYVIYKKCDYKKSLMAILISTVMAFLFDAIMSFSLSEDFYYVSLCGDLFAFLISHFFGLRIHRFMKENTKSSYLLIYLRYVFSLMLFLLVYILFHLDVWDVTYLIKEYLPVLVLFLMISIPLTILEKKKGLY